ncbi:MAG: cysteine desulfurase family protein [Bradymonadaceae bacterium]
MHRIYLDWNATAPVLPEVRDAMVEALDEVPGNASSVHQDGQRARATVEQARRAVASAVGAAGQGVVLTGGATESNNQVLESHVRRTENPTIVCTAVEHPSVLEVVERLGGRGVEVDVCPVDERGRLDLDWLEERLADGVTLVSAMWANNEVGNVYPVDEIAELTDEYGTILHVDATQAFGRIPVDFDACGADVMTLSFHKMGGPKGIGATVLEEGHKVEAFMAGGHQERGRRPGTENVPAAAGLEKAADIVDERGGAWTETLEAKRETFREALEANVETFEHRGDPEARIPNTLNIAFPGVDGEDFLLALDLEGVSASSGSACTAGSLEPSHVIEAMGFDHDDARRSVRFSFGPATSEDDLVAAAERIGRVADRLAQLP